MIQTVDPIIFRFDGNNIQVALYKRPSSMERYPSVSSLPGGMVFEDVDDNIGDTLDRVLKKKAPLKPAFMEAMAPIGNKYRDPDGWSLTIPYLCLTFSSENYTQGEWVDVARFSDGANKKSLPFDHNELIIKSFGLLVNRATYSTLPIYLMPTKFTLQDLQLCCEKISGKEIHKASFRKRWLNSGVLVDTGCKGHNAFNQGNKRNREASLYTMKKDAPIVFFERTMASTI